jgi:hypothetical protein
MILHIIYSFFEEKRKPVNMEMLDLRFNILKYQWRCIDNIVLYKMQFNLIETPKSYY